MINCLINRLIKKKYIYIYIYFTGDDSYQNFLGFVPVFNSLTLYNNNKIVANWILPGISR